MRIKVGDADYAFNKICLIVDKPVQKHLELKYHFIREAVENNKVKLEYLPSTNLMADLLTKPLPGLIT
jgi:hypothetical protein